MSFSSVPRTKRAVTELQVAGAERRTGRAGAPARVARRPAGVSALSPELSTYRRGCAWALASWLICLPVALLLPSAIGLSPFSLRGSATPLLAGAVALTAGALVSARWRDHRVPDAAAGVLAGWVVLTMHTALHGTPYGFGGLGGDMVRVSAMATRYTHTIHSADGIVGTVPADYPPLFPWLIGRAAMLSGVPAWRLLGLAETLVTSAAIVFPYLLWRRLLPAGVALAVTIVCFAAFTAPEKPYEVLALGVVIPWALLTFANPPGGRLHWLPAGVIGGLLIVLYWGFLLFVALGIVALVVFGVRTRHRSGYAYHAAGVGLTGVLVSSWYVVPYADWALTHGVQATDRFQDPLIAANPFPFVVLTPLGVLTAVGLFGLWWYRQRSWWATPLALLTLSAYAFRFLAEVGFMVGGDTEVFQYTVHLVLALLGIAGVLTLVRAAPGVVRGLELAVPAGISTLLVCVLAAGAGTAAWYAWMPGGPSALIHVQALTNHVDAASEAFLQPLPNGRYVTSAPPEGRLAWFPIDPIVRDVDSVLGRGSAPTTLSFSEELFAIQPWPGYLGVGANAASATSEWFSRLAALKALSRAAAPDAFASASAHTPFGSIDVFVLQQHEGTWDWTPTNYPAQIRFRPAQFASPDFVVFRGLPDDTVVAVRR